MSYNGETIKDEALEKYTLGLMEDVVRHYHDRLDWTSAEKLIERGIAKKLVEWIPEKYTEVDIKASVGSKYTSVVAEFMTDMQTMMVVVHEEVNSVEKKEIADPYNTPYDPTSLTEDFWFPNPKAGRGSKVETLPKGDNLDLGFSAGYKQQLRDKIKNTKVPEASWKPDAGVTRGIVEQLSSPPVSLGVSSRGCAPRPTNPQPVTPKTNIDFTAISGINPAKAQDWNRNTDSSRSTYYSIDVNAAMKESIMDAEKESMISTAKLRLQELADQVAYDTMVGTTATEEITQPLTMAELQEIQTKYTDWACGTSGWSREYTNSMFGDIPKPTNNNTDLTWLMPAEMTWYNPYPLTSYDPAVANDMMEEISFTEADLDELSDLINDVQSEVMNFE